MPGPVLYGVVICSDRSKDIETVASRLAPIMDEGVAVDDPVEAIATCRSLAACGKRFALIPVSSIRETARLVCSMALNGLIPIVVTKERMNGESMAKKIGELSRIQTTRIIALDMTWSGILQTDGNTGNFIIPKILRGLMVINPAMAGEIARLLIMGEPYMDIGITDPKLLEASAAIAAENKKKKK